jgi:hypothetical protein
MFQIIEFKVELTLSLDLFVDFITHVLEHGDITNGHKTQLLVSEQLNVINKVGGISNVPCNKISEKLGTPVRKVTDILLGQTETGENVLRLLQITQI